MRSTIRKGSLAVALLALMFLSTGANVRLGELPHRGQQPEPTPFKLKGAGQVDFANAGFDFSGTATHLGKYSATGAIDFSTFAIHGNFEAANGDTLDWTAEFSTGPLGELEATFTFSGGTGRFTGASGSASGPVALDPDLMFLLTLQGTIMLQN